MLLFRIFKPSSISARIKNIYWDEDDFGFFSATSDGKVFYHRVDDIF